MVVEPFAEEHDPEHAGYKRVDDGQAGLGGRQRAGLKCIRGQEHGRSTRDEEHVRGPIRENPRRPLGKMRAQLLDDGSDEPEPCCGGDTQKGSLASGARSLTPPPGKVGQGAEETRNGHCRESGQKPHRRGRMDMTTARACQSQKYPEADHHAESRKPVPPVHPVAILKGDDPEDDHQLGGDQRLHQTQAPDPQCLDLKDKAQDHAQDPQKPDRAAEEVADQAQAEAELLGSRGSRPALRHRRRRGEAAGDQRQHDHPTRHARHLLQLQLPLSTTPMVVPTQLVHKSSRQR